MRMAHWYPIPLFLLLLSACTEKRVVDDSLPPAGPCASTGRADDFVRQVASEELKKFGKVCEPAQITLYPLNERETVWRACCLSAGMTFAFYPARCVAHRTSGQLVECSGDAPLAPSKAPSE